MAAGGFKEFVAGETLDEDEINDYLMQGMLVFAGTAARGSAIGTPVEGQFSFLTDTDAVEFYDGSAWVELSTTPGAAVVSGTTGSPTLGTVSSGGTTYNVYSFTGDGSIIISEAGFAEILVIGGGAGGGYDDGGGGGGAGGYLAETNAYLAVGTATVLVGAGGAASTDQLGRSGESGETSAIQPFYSSGGGSGAGYRSLGGDTGGSGGGGCISVGVTSGGSGTSGLGFAGGTGVNGGSGNRHGGGGGGASEVGGNGNASTQVGGDGGDGLASSITGSSVTRAGGGGGGSTDTGGSGGAGGGGNGGTGASNATAGSANTGGGGGGSGPAYLPAAGGSGIVIVRVAV